MIKAIISDCFGVLYIHKGQHFYETTFSNYPEIRDQLSDLGRQCDYGLITQQEFVSQVAELSGVSADIIEQGVMGGFVRNQSLLEYLQSQRTQKISVGLLSNISQGSIGYFFSETEQSNLFDAVVLSGDEGIVKPHPRIYELCAQRLGFSTGECVMIDDSLENCAGADAAGMRSIVFRDTAQTIEAVDSLLARESTDA